MATDTELVTRYVAGDRQALAEIYDRYADRIHDLCVAMLGVSDDAADAFSDTFLVAARRLTLDGFDRSGCQPHVRELSTRL